MSRFSVVALSATPSSLSDFLADITTILTTGLGWVGKVAGTVASEPMLLVPAVMGIAMVGIGIYHKLRH